MAKDADLIAIQVFTKFTDPQCADWGLPSPCALSFTSDQISALERVYELRTSFNIASANMSLGGGMFSSPCDTDARKSIIDNLRSVGIATVINAGNSGYTDALAAPACISSAISAGSSNDTSDEVSFFSNVADFLDLLAPGTLIYSSVPDDLYSSFQGTSMSAPHVACAWAVLKSKNPEASVGDVLTAFTATGVPVDDQRSGASVTGMPRIEVDDAVLALVAPSPQTIGIQRGDIFPLRRSNTGGPADLQFTYGISGDIPVVGDWDGDGVDTVGIFREGAFHLRNANSAGIRICNSLTA